MMYLSQFSTEDLKALDAGDLSRVSTEGLKRLRASVGNAQEPPIDPTEGMSTGEKIAAGAGKFFVDTLRAVGQPLGLVSQADIEESRRLDRALMDTTAGKVGNFGAGLATLAPISLIPGANTYAGATAIGAITGAGLTPGSLEERLKSGVIGAAGGVVGKAVGDKVMQAAVNRWNKAQALATANAPRDATLAAAKEAGYVVPPASANPTILNRTVESFAGKINTQQAAAIRNQPVTNDLARQALGLPKGAPLTRESLSTLRSEAGKAYDALEAVGSFRVDGPYLNAIRKLADTEIALGKQFPTLQNAKVIDLANSLAKAPGKAQDATVVIEATKRLKNDGFANRAPTNAPEVRALGKAQITAANELENLIERNLKEIGNTRLLENFRNARELIAKTYSVEKALNPATGNVSAANLGRQVAKGRPLSDELKKAGEFALAFPKAAQEVTTSMPGASPLDWIAAGGISAASGHPGYMALAAARPIVRAIEVSRPYQSMVTTPTYLPGLLGQAGWDVAGGMGRLGAPIGGLLAVGAAR